MELIRPDQRLNLDWTRTKETVMAQVIVHRRLHLPRPPFRGALIALVALVVGGLLVAGVVRNATRVPTTGSSTTGSAVGKPMPAITRGALPAQPSVGAPGFSGKATSR